MCGWKMVEADNLATSAFFCFHHTPALLFSSTAALLGLHTSPPLFLLLLLLLPFPEDSQTLVSESPLLLLPLALAVAQPLLSTVLLEPLYLPRLHLPHRLLVTLVHETAVGHKAEIEILVLHGGNAGIIIGGDLDALEP